MLCFPALQSKDNIITKIVKFVHHESPSEIFQALVFQEQAFRRLLSCISVSHSPQILKKFLLNFYKCLQRKKEVQQLLWCQLPQPLGLHGQSSAAFAAWLVSQQHVLPFGSYTQPATYPIPREKHHPRAINRMSPRCVVGLPERCLKYKQKMSMFLNLIQILINRNASTFWEFEAASSALIFVTWFCELFPH